jgi:hypothetical protein
MAFYSKISIASYPTTFAIALPAYLRRQIMLFAHDQSSFKRRLIVHKDRYMTGARYYIMSTRRIRSGSFPPILPISPGVNPAFSIAACHLTTRVISVLRTVVPLVACKVKG